MQSETYVQGESQGTVMRLMDAQGNIGMLPVSDFRQLRKQFWNCRICVKHNIVCRSGKAYKLHLLEEHAY